MRKRDIVFFSAAVTAAVLVVLNVDIKTPAQYYALHPTEVTEDGAFIDLHIDCKAVAASDNSLPADGVFLDGRYALVQGESVFDVTARVLGSEGVPFDYTGTSNIYVNGIGGLYELDYGACSGWIYTVNGSAPDISCGDYFPVSGDSIEFIYVDDYYGGDEG